MRKLIIKIGEGKNGGFDCFSRGFIFNQINKLTIKINSSLSNIKISYYLKFRIPIMHRQFSRTILHNPEYVENFCNDLNNLFHFACRKWMIKQ